MDWDTGPKGLSFDSDSDVSSNLSLKAKTIILGVIAGISALLSNVTRHDVTGIVQGSYTRVDSGENGTAFSYRVITQDGKGEQVTLRNEPDLFAGKFYGTPTSIQNDMKKAVGQECTFEVNGTDFLILKQNILRVKECHTPEAAPAMPG